MMYKILMVGWILLIIGVLVFFTVQIDIINNHLRHEIDILTNNLLEHRRYIKERDIRWEKWELSVENTLKEILIFRKENKDLSLIVNKNTENILENQRAFKNNIK